MHWQTVLTDSGFPKCSWGHMVTSFTEWCQYLMQCHLKGQRSQAFNVGFWPCRLRAEISPDFLYLLKILWTIDDKIPKFLSVLHWETLFLNCKTICSSSSSQSGEPCLWTTEPFRDAPQNHDFHLFPIYLFTCAMFQTGVFWAFLNFPSFFVATVPAFFGTCCRHQILNE